MAKSSEISNPRLEHALHVLIEHRKLWLLPGLAALALSWFYVYFVRAETYTARQSIIVRDDLLGQSLKPGQFESLDLMKSAQETILEVARKPQVIRNALKKIGPARVGWFGVSDDWPSDETIEDVQSSITFSAPNGAEFGHTEIIVLSTKSNSRERGRAFILALLEEIDIKLNEVRELQLNSMKEELKLIRDSALSSLTESADKLRTMEREVGSDLPTLRALTDPQGGDTGLAQTLLQIRSEQRQAENELDSALSQKQTLEAARDNPDAILATSDELFKFQPALNRLKQELIEAQSSLAASEGRYESVHPEVQKHKEQVRSMHGQIHDELDSAQRGLNSRVAVLTQKASKLRSLKSEIEDTLNRLSSKRVDYLKLDGEVSTKSEVFNQAQSSLAAIVKMDSKEVNLLTPVDRPQVSTRADGLGKTTTILGGGMAGFLAGFGLVLLLAPSPDNEQTPHVVPTSQPTPTTTRPQTTAPAPPTPTTAPASTSPVAAPPSNPVVVARAAVSPPNVAPAVIAAAAPATKPIVEVTPVAKVEKPAVAVSEKTPTTPSTTTAAPAEAPPAKNRGRAIEAEIDQAVAKSDQQAATPTKSLPQGFTATPEKSPVAKKADSVATKQPADSNRGTGDSSGVPTAASILAELNKVRLTIGTNSTPVITPQTTESSETVASSLTAPEPKSQPDPPQVEIKPVMADAKLIAADDATHPDLQRRQSQRPIDIVKQNDTSAPVTMPAGTSSDAPKVSTSFVSLEPNVNQPAKPDATPVRKPNPFLRNDKETSDSDPTATAKQMLADAKAEATRKGLVPPVAPAAAETKVSQTEQAPSTTVPIPEQIRRLTESISSFAKPIKRVSLPEQDEEF